jgi:hypothetical protein
MDGRLAAMASQIKALMDGFDPRQIVVTEYRPILDYLVDNGVGSKSRRSLSPMSEPAVGG